MKKHDSLRKLFLKQGKLCYLYNNDISCDVVDSLIDVFYDLGIGEEVEPLIEKASERNKRK